ncbi:MAG: rhamnulokinase [Akkermansiaceae bacterium]|nr:rhamnulokinase [Akkermansiaceae bacterium]
MKSQVYLGIDLGAESGRVIAGIWDGKKIRLEEMHRFRNGPVNLAGTLRWDVIRLWEEIQNGLTASAKKFGDAIQSIGVDTWGVDYVLLSKTGEIIGQPYNYRDPRTEGALDAAFKVVPREEIFVKSGLQFMEFNTLYQLAAHQRHSPETLEMADTFLMIPDFLNWCLSGQKAVEFTNATTTQFVDPATREWSTELLGKFNIPTHFFPKIVAPGSSLGPIRESLSKLTGLGANVQVIAPATHDTGSAIVGVPTRNSGRANWAYISSGTWSLMGAEVNEAKLGKSVLERNFTNEGGVDGTYRLLKNIMGLWLVQELKRTFDSSGTPFEYSQLVHLAETSEPLRSLIDPDDPRFFRPGNMPQRFQDFCRETNQPIPETEGQLVRCALESLALKYGQVLSWIEEITGETCEVVHIVGGGCRNQLLNQFTADCCQRPVIAGPIEGTVLGNLLVQARSAGAVNSLDEIRSVIRDSFSEELVEFQPVPSTQWEEAKGRFAQLLNRPRA